MPLAVIRVLVIRFAIYQRFARFLTYMKTEVKTSFFDKF